MTHSARSLLHNTFIVIIWAAVASVAATNTAQHTIVTAANLSSSGDEGGGGGSVDATSVSNNESRDKLAETRDWLERFSQQLRRALLQYSRADVIRKRLHDAEVEEEARNNYDSEAESEKFLSASQLITKSLSEFFESKIQAIRTLVNQAELLSRQFYEASRNLSASKSAQLCEHLLRAINESSLHEAPNSTAANYRFVDRTSTTVHVALNEYKCDQKILDDFEWTNDSKLIKTMRETLSADRTVARQYLASYNGLTRIFPAFKWDALPSEYTIDLFDARFRSWFTAAETAPRDVLFLIDYSGSVKGVTLHMTKTLIQQVLSLLTPNDFFTGVWYNSRRDLILADCLPRRHGGAGARFLPATSRNKQLFQRYLDRVEERDQATLPPALNLSFTQFLQNSRSDASGGAWERERRTSGGHKLILLFSDGVEIWPVDVVKQFQTAYPDDKIRVFGHSMGRGTGRLSALDWLTCATGGATPPQPASTVVSAITDIRARSRAHVEKLSEILALAYRNKSVEQRPITWSIPYMDAQKLGAVVSLSQPILDWRSGRKQSSADDVKEMARFHAVVGVDFALDDLRQIFEQFGAPALSTFETNSEGNGGPTVYAFLVDNNGIVYYHPRLRIPKTETYLVRRTACHRMGKHHRNSNTRLQYGRADEHVRRVMGQVDSIPTIDMLELEFRPSSTFRKFREKIINGECTSEHGHSLKDETQKREYRCYHIANTPLSVGFVRAEQLTPPSDPAKHPLRNVRGAASHGSKNNKKKRALFEKSVDDPLAYWLHDARFVASVCARNSDVSINLDGVKVPERLKMLSQIVAERSCPILEAAAETDASTSSTASSVFLRGERLTTTSLSLLLGADALLSEWRDTWPSAQLPPVNADVSNIVTAAPAATTHANGTNDEALPPPSHKRQNKRRRKRYSMRHIRARHVALSNYRSARSADVAARSKSAEKKNTVGCTINGTQFIIPRAFDPRYFIAAFVDFPAASLSAFFPKCQTANISSVISAYLLQSQLAPLPKSERAKLRVDVSRVTFAGDTAAEDAAASSTTLVVAEKIHRKSDAGYVEVLATIGAQFTSHFFHEKFQRSLNASREKSAKSWPECQMANRRCYLLTTSAYVVASTEKNFPSIAHLSIIEPQIFEHLIKGDVIQKTTWTDYQAECAVSSNGSADPHSVRKQLEFQRKLFNSIFGGGAASEENDNEDDAQNSTTALKKDTSAPSSFSSSFRRADLLHSISNLPAIWFDVFTRIETMFGIFLSLAVKDAQNAEEKATQEEEDDDSVHIHTHSVDDVPACEYGSNSDAATPSQERCVVEHTLYTLRARQTLSVKSVHYRIGCNSDLIIVPSTIAQLHLLILDEKCDNFPTIPCSHHFMPHRVADCGLTSTRSRRLRTDIDYTRTHPEEYVAECYSAATLTCSSPINLSFLFLLFLLKLNSNSIFLAEFL